ncbi:MAG: hypothetical protein ACRCWR_02710 [Saezia sp.]
MNKMYETKEEKAARENRAKSWLGAVNLSRGVNALLTGFNNETLAEILYRHAAGDWGSVCDDDWQSNNDALANGERVISAYLFEGVQIWVITEADRTRTTALLPSEY